MSYQQSFNKKSFTVVIDFSATGIYYICNRNLFTKPLVDGVAHLTPRVFDFTYLLQMPIIKTQKTENFCVVPNAVLNNPSLSFKSKGLLCYLLSKPNHWQINVQQLSKASTEGRDSIYSSLKELETIGFLERNPVRTAKGTFSHYDYIVFDEQQSTINGKSDATTSGKSDTLQSDYPLPENPTVVNTDNTSKTVLVKNEEKIKNSKIKFCKRVIEWATKNPDKYPKLMYFDFAKHWLELAQSEKSVRYEGEKFFEIGKRLATWFSFSDNNKLSAQWTAEKDTGTINSLLLKLL